MPDLNSAIEGHFVKCLLTDYGLREAEISKFKSADQIGSYSWMSETKHSVSRLTAVPWPRLVFTSYLSHECLSKCGFVSKSHLADCVRSDKTKLSTTQLIITQNHCRLAMV